MNETIFLIEDEIPKEFSSIMKSHPQAKILALNYPAHRSLEKNQIPHELGDKFLTKDDKNAINQTSIHSTINWEKNIGKTLEIENIELTQFIEFELLQYFLPIFRMGYSIVRIIEELKPETVIIKSTLNDFTKKLCDNKINFLSIIKSDQPKLEYDRINIKIDILNRPISFTISRNLFSKLKSTIYKISNLFLNNSYDSKKKSILLLDFNPIQYENLLSELNKIEQNVLLLNQRRPAIWNYESFKIIKKLNVKSINLHDYTNTNHEKLSKSISYLDTQLEKIFQDEEKFKNFFQINSVSLWPSIKKSFSEICRNRLHESTTRIILLKNFFENNNISSILEWAELSQEENEVLTISKQFKIPSLLLQHAMYPTSKIWEPFSRFALTYNYPSKSDIQAIWGDLTQKHAESSGHNPNLRITGSPRHDKFFTYNNKKKSGKILLATTVISNYDTNFSTIDYFIKFNEFVKEVYRVIKKFPDKELIVKPHPVNDSLNDIINVLHEIDPKIKISHTQNLEKLIADCDLVITFNNSTVALESIILDVPVITLQVEEWANDISIVNSGAIMAISEISEIEGGVKKILSDDDYRQKLIHKSREFVNNYMSYQGTASSKISDLISNL